MGISLNSAWGRGDSHRAEGALRLSATHSLGRDAVKCYSPCLYYPHTISLLLPLPAPLLILVPHSMCVYFFLIFHTWPLFVAVVCAASDALRAQQGASPFIRPRYNTRDATRREQIAIITPARRLCALSLSLMSFLSSSPLPSLSIVS